MTTSTASARRARRLRVAVVSVIVVAALGGTAYGIDVLVSNKPITPIAEECHAHGYEIDPDQAATASTMVGAVTTYSPALPERAAVLVLAAGLQESKLRNLPPGAGDRDSVGVLQQRPSQGWGDGNAAKLNDVTEATREFLKALRKVHNWQRLPLATAVQDVQISADGSLYAQHEPEAQALADALTGTRAAGISCTFPAPTLVASARTVASQASYQLGIDTPVGSGHRVRVPGAGWQTSAWLVANADRLGIETVAHDGRTWTRTGGWARSHASAATVTATLYSTPSS